MTQTNEQSANLPASHAEVNETPATYVSIYATTDSDIGDGWDDYESAVQDWKRYLQHELHAWLSDMYPEAEISVEVRFINGTGTLDLDTDAADLNEVWVHNAMEKIFQNFCEL